MSYVSTLLGKAVETAVRSFVNGEKGIELFGLGTLVLSAGERKWRIVQTTSGYEYTITITRHKKSKGF